MKRWQTQIRIFCWDNPLFFKNAIFSNLMKNQTQPFIVDICFGIYFNKTWGYGQNNDFCTIFKNIKNIFKILWSTGQYTYNTKIEVLEKHQNRKRAVGFVIEWLSSGHYNILIVYLFSFKFCRYIMRQSQSCRSHDATLSQVR